VIIQSDNTRDAMLPQIAMDSTGTAIAVWMQADFASQNIWANRFDGVSWGTAELIETNDAGDAMYPQISMDGTGAAMVVWRQNEGIRDNIWANRFDGMSWGTAKRIETDDTGDAALPQIAMDATGTAIAIWRQNDGFRDNIWANRFDGASWGTAELIETDDAGNAGNPQIAMDGNGIAIAVWRQNDGTRENIHANRFDGMDWGTAELIETDDAGDAEQPQIAMDATGTAIAVWTQYDDSSVNLRANIRANRFDGMNWGTAELVETHGTSLATLPQVAMDGNGAAIAVWQQKDELPASIFSNIWANRFDGSSWNTPELIETDNAGDALLPQIATDGTGTAMAVWHQLDTVGGIRSIWANRFDDSSWGTAELLENDFANDAGNPQTAMDGTGAAITVWDQNQGGVVLENIWANRFE